MAEIKPIHEIIQEISPHYASRAEKKAKGLIETVADTEHTLTYESYTDYLEPVYYFILDLMGDFGLKAEKLIDNFSPAPGSTQFAEMGGKATAMQSHAKTIMADINTVLRSVLNIIYDLKDFRMRLSTYDDLKVGSQDVKDAAVLSLKQLWMDKVDINKGNSSIKALAVSGGFPTMINAFLAAKELKDVTSRPEEGGLDLNDVVRRILIPRVQEFDVWIKQSEAELRKRYALEKNYLRTQVNSLKLYSRWAKPYLLNAQKLEQKQMPKNAAIVNSFNRSIMELTLIGKSSFDAKAESIAKELPEFFQKEGVLRKLRHFNQCVLIDFVFRAVPVQQSTTYIGRVDVTFRSYSLTDDELAKVQEVMDESDLGNVLTLIEGATDESLKQLQDEIDFFLEEEEPGEIKPDKKAESSDQSNPFLALIGFYNKKPEKPKEEPKSKKKEPIIVPKDTWLEDTQVRPLSASKAATLAFNLFDVYKKAHGMASYT